MEDDFMTIDTIGDGLDDSILQFNDDGSTTIYSDLDYDGNYEQITHLSGCDYFGQPTEIVIGLDTDNNGIADTFYAEIHDDNGNLQTVMQSNDYNQDGELDSMKVFADNNGDGLFDIVGSIHADNSDSPVINTMEADIDLSGDQNSDMHISSQMIDDTGNGQPDRVTMTITDPSGESYSYGMTVEEYRAFQNEAFGYNTCNMATNGDAICAQFNPDAANPDMVAGDPASDMQHWEFQGPTGRCALYAQKFVIEEALGREVPIEELVDVAEQHGWFNEAQGGGTVTLNMDKLLEYYGVESEMSFDNDIEDLEQALNNGDNVIVSVDSGQIWYADPNNIFSPETQSDHAVQVIGIDRTNPQNPMVVLNDSGTPEGCGELVPLDVFENAWKAGDAQMIVCRA